MELFGTGGGGGGGGGQKVGKYNALSGNIWGPLGFLGKLLGTGVRWGSLGLVRRFSGFRWGSRFCRQGPGQLTGLRSCVSSSLILSIQRERERERKEERERERDFIRKQCPGWKMLSSLNVSM